MGEEYEAIQSQAHIFKLLSGLAHSMAIKCAVDLRLADIIHSHENPITLSQLASSIDSPTFPDISNLNRVMRLLVRDKIFAAHEPSDGGETLYGTTKVSSLLVSDTEMSLFPAVATFLQPFIVIPWCYLSDSVKAGGVPFEKVNGCKMYEFASKNSEFNKMFNHCMATQAKHLTDAILDKYEGGFEGIRSLVDVGGGSGETLARIVSKYPNINGINFDLPHVISSAPEYNGVTHFGGDMFQSIPKSDVILLKWILHNWSDKDCIEILKKCKEAIPKKSGKVLIADMILNPTGISEIDEMNNFLDLNMLVNFGGKERSGLEWKKLLEDGGFPRYKIINVNPLTSLIEAYPE